MDSKHEERQKALQQLREHCDENMTDNVHAAIRLQGCVAIPQDDYDMLRRALRYVWDHACYVGNRQTEIIDGVTTSYLGSFEKYNILFQQLGFLDANRERNGMFKITDKASEFAREMEGK